MPKVDECAIYSELASTLEHCLNAHARLMLAMLQNNGQEDEAHRDARKACLEARAALHAHEDAHGCNPRITLVPPRHT